MSWAEEAFQARDERSDGSTEQADDLPAGRVDRDSILRCPEFCRLAEITQVAQATDSYRVHNRLTHSLKVAHIGRRIAERLTGSKKRKEQAKQLGGLDPDVVEAAGLAHDLGHPPFGHAAEETLRRLVKDVLKDLSPQNAADAEEGFGITAQSFRIATKLAGRRKCGLNLTNATLNAILRHPRRRLSPPGQADEKWGFYAEEEEDFLRVRKAALYRHGPTLEAEVVNWANDIASSVYDINDFYRAGLIPLDRIIGGSPSDRLLLLNSFADGRPEGRAGEAKHKEHFRNLLGLLATRELLKEPYEGGNVAQRESLEDVTALLVGHFSEAVSLVDPATLRPAPANGDPAGEEATPPRLLKIDDSAQAEVDFLKQLTRTYVLDQPRLYVRQEGQREIIRTLFDKVYRSADQPGRNLFTTLLRTDINKSTPNFETDHRLRARTVIDYLSAMTEMEAVQMSRRLTGHTVGFETDQLSG